MIVEPRHLEKIALLDTPVYEMFENRLTKLHQQYRTNANNSIFIPKYWSETVYYGVQDVISEWPGIKFGSIIEDKHKLMVYTMPTNGAIEKIKRRIYNNIDTLIVETIDNFLKGHTKPSFLE